MTGYGSVRAGRQAEHADAADDADGYGSVHGDRQAAVDDIDNMLSDMDYDSELASDADSDADMDDDSISTLTDDDGDATGASSVVVQQPCASIYSVCVNLATCLRP